jgi:hypothetical protein
MSVAEAAAYRMLGVTLADLRKVEDLLRRLDATTPSTARARDLTEVEKARAALERILPTPEPPLYI